jgi:Sulfotransferase domain
MSFSRNILVGCAVLVSYYIVSLHRIKSLRDASKAISVASLETEDERCKRFNSTHFICLPNILFIGASKCGTTSMMSYLLSHPSVRHVQRRISPIDNHKEVHRFDRNSYGWSLSFIELADEWASSPLVPDKDFAVIHYTPHYLYAPTVPFEMRKFYRNPESLKFIVILRDPIERALSSYWFQHSHLFRDEDSGSIQEFQKLSMSEISQRRMYDECMTRQRDLARGASRNSILGDSLFSPHLSSVGGVKSASCKESCMKGFRSPDEHFRALKQCFGRNLRSTSLGSRHLDKGIYYDQLLRWRDNFPSKNFHITSLERWAKNASVEYEKLLSFIFTNSQDSLSSSSPTSPSSPSIRHHIDVSNKLFERKRLVKPNKLSSERDNQLTPEFREVLEEFYQPYNEKLRTILDTDSLLLSTYH